jgi:SET domain-containing protein
MKDKLLPLTKIFVGKSSCKGRGVFAAQDLEQEELIEESHFIISGCASDLQDEQLKRYVFSLFYNEKFSAEENERLNFQSLFKLRIDDQDIQNSFFQELKDLGYDDSSKIFSTAAVLGYGMIYNHSLNPNIEWDIDYNDFVFKYKTNQKISKGQELFINYGNPERKDLK